VRMDIPGSEAMLTCSPCEDHVMSASSETPQRLRAIAIRREPASRYARVSTPPVGLFASSDTG